MITSTTNQEGCANVVTYTPETLLNFCIGAISHYLKQTNKSTLGHNVGILNSVPEELRDKIKKHMLQSQPCFEITDPRHIRIL